jgi:hypothetical protein
MKTKIQKQFGLMIVVALVLGFGQVRAQAADGSAAKPDRPTPNKTDLKAIIQNFQDQKKQFLAQQKEQQGDTRTKLRDEVGSSGSLGNAVRDAKDAIAEAKSVAREQARKLADEAREAAKNAHKRD